MRAVDVEMLEQAARERMRKLGAFLLTANDVQREAVGITLVAMGAAMAADNARRTPRRGRTR